MPQTSFKALFMLAFDNKIHTTFQMEVLKEGNIFITVHKHFFKRIV